MANQLNRTVICPDESCESPDATLTFSRKRGIILTTCPECGLHERTIVDYRVDTEISAE